MKRLPSLISFVVVVLVSLGWAGPAFADREVCARSYEAGQRLRLGAKLLDARREFLSCAQDTCPAVLRKDCAHWLEEIADIVPAVAVQARGADGCDRPLAHISIDGTAVPHAAEGRPIEVDPGPHTFKADIDGASVDQSIVMSVGERRRIVVLSSAPGVACGVRDPGPPPPPPPLAPPIEQHEREWERHATPPLVYVLGGVGLVGLGVGTGFGISAWSQKGTLDDCKGACGTSDVDTMQRTFLVTDIAVGVGVVALAAAAILYLTR